MPTVSKDLSTLRLYGRLVGECSICFQFGLGLHRVVEQIMVSFQMKNNIWTGIRDLSTRRERFVEAFFCHDDRYKDYPMEEVIQTILEISNDLNSPTKEERQHEFACRVWLNEVLPTLAGKTVFLIFGPSVHGFGTTTVDIKDGDLAVLADTAKSPFILRRCSDKSTYWRSFFRLVGQAFIDGLSETDRGGPYWTHVKSTPQQAFLLI
jgi:hypothetical protein